MDKLEFSIASEIGNIVKVENFIDYFSDVYNVEPDVFGKISLCVIEAVNNAILYGNKLDSSKYVKFLVYEEYISLQFSFVFLIISNINYKKLNIYEFNFIYTYISIL